VRSILSLVADIRPYFSSDPDLLRVVMNSTSLVEATLAMELLTQTVPERALITAANIREAIKELPRCPLSMAVDFETLARVWELERVGMGWERQFDDRDDDFTIVLLGEGNFCYDIVVRLKGRTMMWMPRSPEEDFVNPDLVDLVMEHHGLLRTVIDLVGAMGMPFSPAFYLSLEDWQQEYAETTFSEVVELFGNPDDKPKRPTQLSSSYFRKIDMGGVNWLG